MIEARGLIKRYGEVRAVEGIDLNVQPGELFCFLGPNGAGKTTTIKMLTGLLHPTAGSIAICGVDLLRDPVGAKRSMGYIPDMPYIYERLTSREFFAFAGALYRMDPAVIAAREGPAFEQFGLHACGDMLVKDLSHGMRQRLIYAATFLHEPRVLFIDEPLIGLDPHTIRMIKTLLRARAAEGMTIFLTTHILALAQDIADRIGIIDGGRMIALGSMADLRRQAGLDGTLEDVFLALTGEGATPEA
jgi:ABC-2 type transport system ATP-binding protein